MTETSVEKRITITLTDHAPVRVSPIDWPTVADARWHAGEHECQAGETAYLRVRQHADGRTIVYGARDRGPGGMPAGYVGLAGGIQLAAGLDIPAAIRAVGATIDAPASLIAECIADLPPVDL